MIFGIANMYPDQNLPRDLIVKNEFTSIYIPTSVPKARESFLYDKKAVVVALYAAAKFGNVDAVAAIAHFYLEGLIEDDERFEKAAAWGNKAANAGSGYGFWVLAWTMLETRRPIDSFNAMERGAALQFSPAVYGLGKFYEYGIGVPQDLPMARACYKEALALGYRGLATWSLLNLYVGGQFGIGLALIGGLLRPIAKIAMAFGVVFSSKTDTKHLSYFWNWQNEFKEPHGKTSSRNRL